MERTTTSPLEMVFTMGLPGSGKSTTLQRLGISNTHTTIDPDAFKSSHPDYDPKNPGALHGWSLAQAETQFQAACDEGAGYWIIDGTGTNSDKMVRRMRQARAAGYNVRLIYVRVSLATAIQRNADRARSVPESLIREKELDINVSFGIVHLEANSYIIVDNDATGGLA